jgi:nucleoside-diphosphate-sugar epimerase
MNTVHTRSAALALFGATGVLGQALAPLLAPHRFRAVGRSHGHLTSLFAAYPNAELAVWDPAKPDTAVAALQGVETMIYLVGVPYTDFRLHPPLFEQALTAAIQAGVKRCLLVGTVYPFGLAQTDSVQEDHPRSPHTFKGKMRKQQEDILLSADAAGRISGAILRLPDFYGPKVSKSYLASLFDAAVHNKTAQLIGPLSIPHEYVYIPDAAQTLLRLAREDRAYGRPWHLAGAGRITQAELIQLVESIVNRPIKKLVIGKRGLQLFGLLNPLLREVAEMHYLQTHPLFLNDKALTELLGPLIKTPYADGVRASVAAESA